MFAIILKELRSYTQIRKYRRIHFIIVCILAVLLFAATLEFYAQSRKGPTIDVGRQTYTFFIIGLFISNFLVPRHIVEALHAEQLSPAVLTGENLPAGNCNPNAALIRLTPITPVKILAGKLSAVVVWMLWGIWLTIPLLTLSIYIGGLAPGQLFKCGVVLLVSGIFFSIIGIGFALWHPPTSAKGYSYAVILLITFLPQMPLTNFNLMPVLKMISPLCALLSIRHSESMWVWHIGMLSLLSVLIFAVLVKRFGRYVGD